MNFDNCNLLLPWGDSDLTPCFRETMVDAALPLAFLTWSIGSIVIVTCRFKRSRSSFRTPLKTSLPIPQSYGSTSNQGDEGGHTKQQTHDLYEEKVCQWSIYNWSRLLAIAQCIIYCHALANVYFGDYVPDPLVEGSSFDLLVMYGGQSILWLSCAVLAVVNLVTSPTLKPIGDEMCLQLNILYFVHFVVGLVDLHSFYGAYNYSTISSGYAISLYTTIISMLLLIFAVNEERHAPSEPVVTDTGRTLSGESWASLYSQFMFSWVDVMMTLGYQHTIDDQDLTELPAANRSSNALSDFRRNKQPGMWRSLAYTFRRSLLVQAGYSLVWSIAVFGPPFYLNKILKYIETPDPAEPTLTAYIYVFGLFITSCINSLASQQALHIGRTLSIRIKSIVIGEIYGKSLRRRDLSSSNSDTQSSAKDSKGADINNLLSIDATKVSESTAYVFYAYAYPLQLVICTAALYSLLGFAAFYGVLVLALTQPITYWIGNLFKSSQKALMAATDKRLKIVNELLGAIRIVKFFAWEKELRARVTAARELELKAVRDRLMMLMWMLNSWLIIPMLVMVAVLYAFTRESALTASIVFTALSLFIILRSALNQLPMIISSLLQARVSMDRVVKFLDEDEVEPTSQGAHPSQIFIGFVDNATFGWDNPRATSSDENSAATPILKDLNISFPRNKLSIICGPTGSGKSTLLSSLLNETYRYSGSVILPARPRRHNHQLGDSVSGIAYVAQTAWIQNCSIRNNILFGLDFDEDRYAKVLYMTALTRDLDILEFGDETEVGEKGVNLSGGQKQRLAIARAIYSDAETIILDDCLSAVDAHTAKHLYDNCIRGELMIDRTVIMVTHYVALCMDGASYIVSLKNGKVAAAGDPRQVLQTGALGYELANAKDQQKEDRQEMEEEGPIPSVPLNAKSAKTGAGSKLVKDEVRAEGSVPLSVYASYFFATGGYSFWFAVLFFFSLTEAIVMGQDYWLKVWSQIYSTTDTTTPSLQPTVLSTTHLETLNNGGLLTNLLSPNAHQLNFFTTSPPLKDPHSINVMYYLGVYFAIGLVSVAVATVRYLVLNHGSIKASRRLHSQLLDRILRARIRFFDTTPLGRIVNRFSSDMETIDQEVSPQFSYMLHSAVMALMDVILVSVVTPGFLIPGVLIAVVFWKIGIYYLETSRDLKRLVSVSRSPIYTHFHEAVTGGGVATIRAFGAQDRFIKDNYDMVDNNIRPYIWMWATNRWLHCRVDIAGAFVGFCAGFVLVLSRNWVDAGLAGLSLSYALSFTSNILWVVRSYAMNEMNLNAVERISEYLDLEEEPPALIPETMPRASWPEDGSIKVDNLVVKYAPESPAVLRNVSFEVKPREKVAIVGRTGSGKSTFCLSLWRFMEATSGSITIDGVDISTLGLETLRSRLTIIPQDPVLFSGTLRSNLDPFNQYDDASLWAAVKRSHLVGSLGNEESSNDTKGASATSDITLDSVVSESGKNFSAGQRQLIALARALVKRSSLIVLDEATSSVDFETDRKIQRTIRSEFNDSALLCVAHRLRTICDYDRVLVLDDGEVMEYDSPYQLMMKDGGIFQQMCQRSGEFSELLAMAQGKTSLT